MRRKSRNTLSTIHGNKVLRDFLRIYKGRLPIANA